jgi:hypothetical protein
VSLSDEDLEFLRTQARFMATGGQHSGPSWGKVADALKELQERREQDNAKPENQR